MIPVETISVLGERRTKENHARGKFNYDILGIF
jgi:hypothetical protein